MKLSLFWAAILVVCFQITADVKIPNVLGDNMVLQRQKPVAVWGTAENGEKVTVTFAGNTANATAENGMWKVQLPPMQANAKPQNDV